MKSYKEKLLATVINPKKIEALDRHLKLRALGFFIIFNWFNYIHFHFCSSQTYLTFSYHTALKEKVVPEMQTLFFLLV